METLSTPEHESVTGGGGEGGGGEGVWGEMWRCTLALPAVHLNFSPDGAMFATASRDDHFVKIWYQSKTGECICTCPTRGSSFLLGKVTSLGVLCCFALLFV